MWVVTLPFSVDESDLTLRPGFLSLLDTWVERARRRASPRRGDVGVPWSFPSGRRVTVEGPAGPVEVARDADGFTVAPARIGTYRIAYEDGKTEIRVASPVVREVDLRPHAVEERAGHRELGDTHASVDMSWAVALFLLGLTACELVLRLRASKDPQPAA